MANEQTRVVARRPIRAEAMFRIGDRRQTVSLLDLSTHGARIRALTPMRAQSRIWLKLPGIEPVQAEIAWTDQFESGCRFVQPLHPSVLEAIGCRASG